MSQSGNPALLSVNLVPLDLFNLRLGMVTVPLDLFTLPLDLSNVSGQHMVFWPAHVQASVLVQRCATQCV